MCTIYKELQLLLYAGTPINMLANFLHLPPSYDMHNLSQFDLPADRTLEPELTATNCCPTHMQI
jgi:hypothetical protein